MNPFSEINANTKVLPDVTSSDTGGMTMIYESKGGRKKAKQGKSKSRTEKSKVMNGGKSKSKSKKSKSKSKSRRCKNKIINIYM